MAQLTNKEVQEKYRISRSILFRVKKGIAFYKNR